MPVRCGPGLPTGTSTSEPPPTPPDPERIRRLRTEYFGAFDSVYLRSGAPLEGGVFSGTRPHTLPAHGTPGHPAHAFVRSSSFAALVADPALEALRECTDRPDDTRPIGHDLAWVPERLARRWLWTDYLAGDVTVHSPWLVHASLDNTTDAMRLSADVRFVLDGCPVDPRWTQPWSGDDGY